MSPGVALVPELRRWINEKRNTLESESVSITDKLPPREDNEQAKGCVGLSKGHIIISFTVWDNSKIATELLVYNTHIDKTIIMDNYELENTEDVLRRLDSIANKLISGHYDDMQPDRRLSIS